MLARRACKKEYYQNVTWQVPGNDKISNASFQVNRIQESTKTKVIVNFTLPVRYRCCWLPCLVWCVAHVSEVPNGSMAFLEHPCKFSQLNYATAGKYKKCTFMRASEEPTTNIYACLAMCKPDCCYLISCCLLPLSKSVQCQEVYQSTISYLVSQHKCHLVSW